MEIKVPEKEVEFKASVGDDGKVVLKKKANIRRGGKSRAAGGAFELRVRKDLEAKGWTVDKWSNNVDMDSNRVVPCRRVFKPIGLGRSVMTIGTGFPDFVAFDRRDNLFEVIGIEVKMNGTLSREEKEKCCWLLERGIFSQILIASKVKERNRVHVKYLDFLEIRKGMRKEENCPRNTRRARKG
ncbi:hypothetical protein HNV12_03360 [Methanococcoides sp. SA1]|nr:hypothetical protein [Methanococcoides sp. SA1]